MKYTVTVHFYVDAKDCNEAEKKVQARLKGHEVGYKFQVQSAQAHRADEVKVSEELRLFLDTEIQNNDEDVSGWLTNLNYCLDSARDENNECPATVVRELEVLVQQVGGTTCAALFVGGY
jgi:hypothetical protein